VRNEQIGGDVSRSRLPWWQPWTAVALFAFLLHFAWEMLQVPFYAGMERAAHWRAVLTCSGATAGDVVITLVAYGMVAGMARDRGWLRRPSLGRVALYVAVGLAVTVVIELLGVYVLGLHAYAPAMPRVAGVGLTPILQWILLPPLTLWLARRHLGTALVHSVPLREIRP
jgi:hypothetical protein